MVALLDYDLDDPGPRGFERSAPLMRLVDEPPLALLANALDRALIVGDMHGNLRSWQQWIVPAAKRSHANVIIQLGDFGFGWNFDYLPRLDALLGPLGVPVFWIDGNHENFDQLTSVGAFPEVDRTSDLAVMTSDKPLPLVGAHAAPVQTSEYTWYLPRGYSWEWYGKRMLAVGGAYSVDKPYRTPHVSWWEQEELTDADVERAKLAGKVDIVFAHDLFAGPRVPGVHAEWKQDEFAELVAPNRDRLLAIRETARPEVWIHGHYHVGYEMPYGDNYGETIIGLNRESEPGSMIVLDFPSLERSMPSW